MRQQFKAPIEAFIFRGAYGMTTARRALAVSFTSQYIVLSIQFIATIVIARLLTPAEIGIFSIAAAFVAFAGLIRDFGSATYIVQERDLTNEKIRAAFATTLIFGWTMAAAVYLSAPWVAKFYEETGIETVLTFLTINFLLTPFGAVTLAYQQRKVNMMAGMVVKTSSTLVSASVSMGCAYAGQSYMSLVWGSIAGVITAVILAQRYRPKGFPILPGYREIPRVMSFGGRMSLVSILNQVSGIAPELIIGKMLGMAPVGLFSRAQGLISLFSKLVVRGMAPALVPVMARAKREGRSDELARGYLYGLTCLTGLAWPFYVGLGIAAEPVVGVLFGTDWLGAAPLLSIWAVSAFIHINSYLSEQVLVATGHVGRIAKIQSFLVPLRIALIVVAATFSLEAVVATFILLSALRAAVLWPHVRDVLGVCGISYAKAVTPSLIVAATTGLAFVGNAWLWNADPATTHWKIFWTAMLIGGAVFVASLRFTSHPLVDEAMRVIRKLKENIAKSKR